MAWESGSDWRAPRAEGREDREQVGGLGGCLGNGTEDFGHRLSTVLCESVLPGPTTTVRQAPPTPVTDMAGPGPDPE